MSTPFDAAQARQASQLAADTFTFCRELAARLHAAADSAQFVAVVPLERQYSIDVAPHGAGCLGASLANGELVQAAGTSQTLPKTHIGAMKHFMALGYDVTAGVSKHSAADPLEHHPVLTHWRIVWTHPREPAAGACADDSLGVPAARLHALAQDQREVLRAVELITGQVRTVAALAKRALPVSVPTLDDAQRRLLQQRLQTLGFTADYASPQELTVRW